jgi:hypothetical protein
MLHAAASSSRATYSFRHALLALLVPIEYAARCGLLQQGDLLLQAYIYSFTALLLAALLVAALLVAAFFFWRLATEGSSRIYGFTVLYGWLLYC